MKPKHKLALGNYVRFIANEMGLRDWTFDIVIDGSVASTNALNGDDDEFRGVASCTPVPGQKRAALHFLPSLKDVPSEELREIVVHELLHCHFGPLYEWGRHATLEHLGQPTYNVFMFGFAQQWETAVDGIARPWATQFPLIDWKLHEQPESP